VASVRPRNTGPYFVRFNTVAVPQVVRDMLPDGRAHARARISIENALLVLARAVARRFLGLGLEYGGAVAFAIIRDAYAELYYPPGGEAAAEEPAREAAPADPVLAYTMRAALGFTNPGAAKLMCAPTPLMEDYVDLADATGYPAYADCTPPAADGLRAAAQGLLDKARANIATVR